MSKQERINAAREHWENRKVGRPIQSWWFHKHPAEKKGEKGAIPDKT